MGYGEGIFLVAVGVAASLTGIGSIPGTGIAAAGAKMIIDEEQKRKNERLAKIMEAMEDDED